MTPALDIPAACARLRTRIAATRVALERLQVKLDALATEASRTDDEPDGRGGGVELGAQAHP